MVQVMSFRDGIRDEIHELSRGLIRMEAREEDHGRMLGQLTASAASSAKSLQAIERTARDALSDHETRVRMLEAWKLTVDKRLEHLENH